jgi:hypothetical protein
MAELISASQVHCAEFRADAPASDCSGGIREDQAQTGATDGSDPPKSQESPAGAQSIAPAERRWYHIPLPMIGTSSLPPHTAANPIQPLTPQGKLDYAVRRTLGPMALANRGVMAGLNQWQNKPEEWGQGWDAYARRYGYRMTRLAARNSIILGLDLVMRTDQRFDRCDCQGFWPRTAHAFRRVVVARTDFGGETVNAARIAGAYVPAAIAYRLYPERYHTATRVLYSGSIYLAWRGVANMVREFWPEIHRVIRIGPPPDSQRDID